MISLLFVRFVLGWLDASAMTITWFQRETQVSTLLIVSVLALVLWSFASVAGSGANGGSSLMQWYSPRPAQFGLMAQQLHTQPSQSSRTTRTSTAVASEPHQPPSADESKKEE